MYTNAIILFILINVIYVSTVPHQSHMITKRRKYCGENLTSTLRLICRGKYYERTTKRADEEEYVDFEEELKNYLEDIDNALEYPFIPQKLAQSLVPLKMRRGVVDECCYESCSLKELSMYCAE